MIDISGKKKANQTTKQQKQQKTQNPKKAPKQLKEEKIIQMIKHGINNEKFQKFLDS